MSTSSAPRADTFGATSGATTSVRGFEVLSSQKGPNSMTFNCLTGGPGGPGLLSLVLGLFKGLPAD